MAAIATRRFGAHQADIEPNEDREGVQCFVTHVRTGVSNSLALLEDMGEYDEVPRDEDNPIPISDKALREIHAFADRYGY